MIEQSRLWKHRKGDLYLVVFAQIEGNPERGYDTYHYPQGEPHPSLSHAISEGFTERESDDFNVWVIRKGQVVASLWMNEIVDDEDVLMKKFTRDWRNGL